MPSGSTERILNSHFKLNLDSFPPTLYLTHEVIDAGSPDQRNSCEPYEGGKALYRNAK